MRLASQACELADQIDTERAEAARVRAEEQLGEVGDDEVQRAEIEAALERANNRLAVGQH